jgi:hypothetical protein
MPVGMSIEPYPEGLVFGPYDLLVFVDDTGHETFASGHPVYGLGGCAVVGHRYHQQICEPWMAVRQRVTGSPKTPLHARKFSRTATPAQMQAVGEFFRDQQFYRLGAIMSEATQIGGDGYSVLRVMKYVLEARINEILQRIIACKQVRVIVESSQRADEAIAETFADFSVTRGFSKRRPAVEFYFMAKANGEIGLEVADFVMHAVGRQTRRRLEKQDGFARDFQAVFHEADQKYTSYMDVMGFTPN